MVIRTCPAASVAWPHSSTSAAGVNQRRSKSASVALARDGEGGFAEIILRRDRLHQRVVEPALERHDRRRIAGQRPLGERIDLEEGQGRQVRLLRDFLRQAGSRGRSALRDRRGSGSRCPGSAAAAPPRPRSSRSCASWTVQSAGTQTWNWAKRMRAAACACAGRAGRASSGYSAAAARNCSRARLGPFAVHQLVDGVARCAATRPTAATARSAMPNSASAPATCSA